MTLDEKLRDMSKTSTVEKLNEYPNVKRAKNFDELWKNVIEDSLPDKDVVLRWHKLLMDYVRQENSVFTLRACASGEQPRRGCLNQVFVNGKKTFGTFCIDNGIPTYIYTMAKDKFVPSLAEFNEMMIHNCSFPFGWNVTSGEKEISAYPKGKNPGISDKGYKLAHIFPAGKEYRDDAGYKTITDFWKAEFPQGNISDWKQHILPNGKYYRPIHINDESKSQKARRFAVAHFLRSNHPLNFFLVPNKSNTRDKESGILKTNIYYTDHTGNKKDEIGEYSKLIEYVAAKIKDIYKDTNVYQEFLNLIFPVGSCIDPKEENVQIDAEYAVGIWRRNIGNGIALSNISASSRSASAVPRHDNKAVVFCILNDMIQRNLIDADMLTKLSDRNFRMQMFGAYGYPFIIKKDNFTSTGLPAKRFYSSDVVIINGEEYQVCNFWTQENIAKLKEWHKGL